ncbi:MAG: lactate utilization protein B [Saprospiraceae bacterium]
MTNHVDLGTEYLKDEPRVDWHNKAVFNFRKKRDIVAKSIPEWEELRDHASAIKNHVLANLDEYLEMFESNAQANGVQVHWAADAKEHNEIVHSIIQKHHAVRVVKSKSMLTEECGLNHFLEDKGIEIIDTDLGERIVQMRHEPPSHIVAPAIHLKKEEISELFHKELATEKGNNDPTYLTRAAREHLREKFLAAEIGITGVNFAVAENGAVVVVTNEGNADLGCHIPPVQIHCMGIEKLIPRWQDLGIFVRLLAPNGSGQKISVYTSHFKRPKPGCEMHIVLVDNGRSQQLKSKEYYRSLKCIRCSACLNTCPVYRRTGGFSYHTPVGGPIGSILMPNRDVKAYSDLPFASSLCGSCSDVCPVKIDIHAQLYKWRQNIITQNGAPTIKTFAMDRAASVLTSPEQLNRWTKLMRWSMKKLPRWILYNRWNAWGKQRELPPIPQQTFMEWYQHDQKKK